MLQLKELCKDKTQLEAANQRLIFKGRILKDENTVASYEITDGLTVHLVRGKTAAAAGGAQPTAPTASSGVGTGADPMAGMGANPMGGMPPGMGGMGGMGGMPPGMGGMGGMPGMPNMAAGGGPNGMGGMGNMDPAMMNQMMGNPMVQ